MDCKVQESVVVAAVGHFYTFFFVSSASLNDLWNPRKNLTQNNPFDFVFPVRNLYKRKRSVGHVVNTNVVIYLLRQSVSRSCPEIRFGDRTKLSAETT